MFEIIDYTGSREQIFEGTVTELIEKLNLKERRYHLMYTLTTNKSSNGVFQFRAWPGPFANFYEGHVDTGEYRKVFEILGDSKEEILEAVRPFITGRQEWTPLGFIEPAPVRLWLAWHR